MNYFNFFEIKENFFLNEKKLKKKFYSLQRKYHPDMNFENNLNLKNNTLLISSEINKGYYILKNKLKRAEYLLYLNQKKNRKNNDFKLKPEILEKQFKLYKELEELQRKPKNQEKIKLFIIRINRKIELYYQKINNYFKKKSFLKIQYILYELKYLKKILKKTKK